MISRTSLGHALLRVCIYNVIQGSILLLLSDIYIVFTLSLTLTIQNKYNKDFSTPIPDIFPMYLIKNLVGKNWQMENSLLINFVWDISDLMTRGFLLVTFSFFRVTLKVMKHFLGLLVLNSLYSRFLLSNMEDSVPSKLYKISG